MINAQKLHAEFVRLGGARLKLKNKMLAILPEIYESGIWKKYAGSIEEYAGKYGDIAKTTVIKRLRLEENLKDKPCLKAAIATVGVHKVALIAKIATPETDKIMAENLFSMSKMAVQSLSKELRAEQGAESVYGSVENARQLAFNDGVHHAPLCKAVSITKKIELDENSSFLFMKLKTKLGKNLSDKEFLAILLEERAKAEFPQTTLPQNVIAVAKQRAVTISKETMDYKSVTAVAKQSGATISKRTRNCKSVTGDANKGKPAANGSGVTRYIPASKKREVIAHTHGKCAYPNCNSPFQVLHHVNRYSE
ncbi:MAG: hypothetical protein AAB328_04470, partial [candidate division NC10 bacterium]